MTGLDALGGVGKSPRVNIPSISHHALGQAFVNMATEISRLNKMSNTIRRASKEVQILKASNFRIKDEDGNDVEPSLLVHFEHHIRDRFPDASDEIQKRLARAMLLRRKRILHRRHRCGSTEIGPRKEVPKANIALPTAQPTISSEQANPNQHNSQPVSLGVENSAPSQVKSATTLAPDAYKRATSSPSVISASKTVALGSHEVLCFPPAPGNTAKRKYEKLKADHEARLRQAQEKNLSVTDEFQQPEQKPDVSYEIELKSILMAELQAIGEIICPFCLSALPAEHMFNQQKWE